MIQFISSFINDFIVWFTVYSKANPVIAGAISLWGLGTFSYLARNVPSRLLQIISKQCTTKLSIISTSSAFHSFLVWYNNKGYSKRLRAFKISSGKWGRDDATKSIGYGTHFFMYGIRPGFITLNQQDTVSEMERDQIDITIVGRSQKIYDAIFEEIRRTRPPKNQLMVYKYTDDYWEAALPQRKRAIDTIFLNKGRKEKIIRYIDNFKSKEQWYISNGISYQTGIIFYGPPGCGKTSLVKALASYYDVSLYILPVSSLYKINKAMIELPEYSMILLEDLDTDTVTKMRKIQEKKKKKNDEEAFFDFSWTNLSDVLNTIDGIVVNHGRILIATTNHIKKLDGALTRDGRFDLKLELNYAEKYLVKQFVDNYFPGYKIPQGFKPKKKLTPAFIQAAVLEHLDAPEKVIELIADK